MLHCVLHLILKAEENVAQLHARIAKLQARRDKESKSVLNGLEKGVDEHSRVRTVCVDNGVLTSRSASYNAS